MTQWVLTQNYVPLAKWGGADTRGAGGEQRRAGAGRAADSPLPVREEGWGQHLNAEGGGKRSWGRKTTETSDVKITKSPSQVLLSRRRLTSGPRSLQPTQALRRLPSQITLIALQIVSRIRCSFQLNRRLSISILLGEFKWRAYSYRQPGYGVREGVAIAHSETKSRSVKLRNRRE